MAQPVDISQKPLGKCQEEHRNREINSVSIVRPNSNDKDGQDHTTLPPTLEAGAELQFAYSYFNEELFAGRLPDCVITYTRKKNVLGHFCADRFQRVGGALWPELALNPTYLALREDRESLSTLVHEQAHVARHYFGPLNRRAVAAPLVTTTFPGRTSWIGWAFALLIPACRVAGALVTA